uniref:Exportin-1/Importin-beta-like domain-containing protein n=1 Tax=Leersia perrieri TaxID=77586 RepID=A0A0D9XKL7_9ORYZ
MEAQATAAVKEALAALYHHPDDATRTAADRWLQQFQHTLDAWQVQRDFEELPSEAFRPLQDSLYGLLKKFSEGPQKVRTQICIAMAALAVHVPVEDWGGGGIVNWLSDEMKSQQDFIPSFLELLIVLPQECSSHKIAARPERRRQFENDLRSSAEVALSLLTACLGIDQLKEQVLEGFASWLRFCHGISASNLATHPLVYMALSSLNSEQFLEAAVNVTSELIHFTVSRESNGITEQFPLIQVLIPYVMGLKEQLKDSSKEEEDVKAIARLLADMGDSYVELIATGSDDAMQIVNALLEVTSHPEFDISSMTFNFWHHLMRNLTDSDVLIDATDVLGGDQTLKILFTKLIQACGNGQNQKWQPVEAALFCIQAIAKSVSVEEKEILPQVMSLLPSFPHQEQLLQTVCSLIGAFSKWIDAAPSELLLPPLVDILNKGMSTSEDTAAAASVAFKRKFSGSLDGLFQIYQIALSGVGGYKVSSEDSLHLVEALSVVIMTLPPDHTPRALELICQPVINPLQTGMGHTDHGVAMSILQVRTCRRFMGFTIGAMLEEIQTLYQQHHQACFLYLSSEVIKIFGSDPACASYLASLIQALFGHTVQLLRTIQDFTARPDIADDCFLLASRCIRYCPDLFVPTEMFPRLVDCAMAGITIQHREACKSILSFLSDAFDLAKSPEGEKYRELINTIILQRGAILTRIMIASLTGALPSSRLDEVSYVLVSLSRSFGGNMLNWASECITLIPPQALTDSERSRFLNIISDASSGSSLGSITDRFAEISEVCRRNKTVQDIVQGALRPHDLNFTRTASARSAVGGCCGGVRTYPSVLTLYCGNLPARKRASRAAVVLVAQHMYLSVCTGSAAATDSLFSARKTWARQTSRTWTSGVVPLHSSWLCLSISIAISSPEAKLN